MVLGESTPWRFSSTVPKPLALDSLNFLSFDTTYGSLFTLAFIYYVTMTALLLNRDRVKLFKNDVKPIIFVKFILFDKIDTKYEISVSKLTPSRNFSLISLKIESWSKDGL